ncbi:MAG: phosphate-starvation-inducible PsiE family protein [Actinomycetota bacterium]|nr:phosphate-starvation-inducible PsiE family protein [Actinomycetota bacterium]
MQEKFYNKVIEKTKTIVRIMELLVACLLILMILLGLSYLVVKLTEYFGTHFYLTSFEIHSMLDVVLAIFIVIELFRITIAYADEREVLPTVLEAVFVVVARKVVLYEFKTEKLVGAIALALLLIPVVLAYFLLWKREHKEH